MSWLGLDIGGANLKAATLDGQAESRPLPLWQRPAELAATLHELLAAAGPHENVAVTMTGELADCFATKAEGVERIVAAVVDAAAPRRCYFYQTTGELVSADEAREQPLLTAAANWHALARLAGQLAPEGFTLLLDVGSTTTDVIPVVAASPVTVGRTDPERLASFELVYTGIERSPVAALVDALPWRGDLCPVAQEVFATTRDAYLIMEDLEERPTATDTADGRPATRAAAQVRLARMICADESLLDAAEIRAMAEVVGSAQVELIGQAAARVIDRHAEPVTIVVSGSGEFVARRVIRYLDLPAQVISLADRLGPSASRCAAAVAVARLAAEEVRV